MIDETGDDKKGKKYVASMNAIKLYCHNLPINLPFGSFIRVNGWRESYPPKASGFVYIEDNGIEKYATAKLLSN